MTLIPDDLRLKLIANGDALPENGDPIPLVKLFLPETSRQYLLSEIDPADTDLAFALAQFDGEPLPRCAYVSLAHLAWMENAQGEHVTRDPLFKGQFPLSVYTRAARAAGHITDDHSLLTKAAAELAGHSAALERRFGGETTIQNNT